MEHITQVRSCNVSGSGQRKVGGVKDTVHEDGGGWVQVEGMLTAAFGRSSTLTLNSAALDHRPF